MTRSLIRFLFLALVAAGAAGCGLSEYEAKMAAEQKRLDVVDEENKLLGDPIDLPKSEGSGLPGVNAAARKAPDVFLRLPRSISPRGAPGNFGEVLHHFPHVQVTRYGRGHAPGDDLKNSPFEDAYVGAVADGTFDEFRTKVLQPFGVTPTEWSKFEITSPGRGRIEYQATRFVDANGFSFLVYLHSEDAGRVAIILRVPGAQVQSADVKKGVDLCLQSLALGPPAAQLRQRFPTAKVK